MKRRLCAFLLLSYVLLHVKKSYESSEEEREDGEALLPGNVAPSRGCALQDLGSNGGGGRGEETI